MVHATGKHFIHVCLLFFKLLLEPTKDKYENKKGKKENFARDVVLIFHEVSTEEKIFLCAERASLRRVCASLSKKSLRDAYLKGAWKWHFDCFL